MKCEITILFIFLIFNAYSQTPFSNGYQNGYKDGYCYHVQLGCIEPIAPLTPLNKINENINSFKDGYQRGFLEGEAKYKSENFKQAINSNQFQYSYKWNYTEPVDIRLYSQVLKQKQRRYEVRQKHLKFLESKYQKSLSEQIDISTTHYKNALTAFDKYGELFSWHRLIKIEIKSFNPQRIINSFPEKLSIDQAKNLIQKLKNNSLRINQSLVKVNKELTLFSENPNLIIRGTFEVPFIIDYVRDKNSGDFKLDGYNTKPSFIKFDKNSVTFKRGDKEEIIENALYYWGIEDEHYIFYDGYGQLLVINMEKTEINWYYEDNLRGQFLKKSIYSNLRKLSD